MNTNNTSNPPFRIGQKVVAIKDSTPGFLSYYKKGDEFTVDEMRQRPSGWNMSFIERKNGYYHNCQNFAPIEENKERIRYVAVSETLREKAEEVVVESCTLS